MLLQTGESPPPMTKAQRCLLHARCMIAKTCQGRNPAWHWQHILREFGCGEYAATPSVRGGNLKRV